MAVLVKPEQKKIVMGKLAYLWQSESQRAPTPLLGAADWAERYFAIPELQGQPIQIAEYQRRALDEALTTEPNGLHRYSTVVWSDIKKSIKSCIAAAVILWWADTHEWASIKIVANDLKQADSREAFYARRAIELNKDYFLGQREVKVKPSGYTIEFPHTHSRIEAIPIDPAGEAGGNDDLVVYTEMWAWKHEAAKRMWSETTLSPTKFGKSLRWVETYAGFTGESPVLEALYKQGVKSGRRLDDDIEMYANDAARLFALWNTKPRLSWQTNEYYQQEAAVLAPTEFLRMHRNTWVASEAEAIPQAWWDACFDRRPLRVDEKGRGERTPLVVGVDASVSGDCTALSVVSRHPTLAGEVCERCTRIWRPPAGGKMDYDATLTAELERMVMAGFNIVEVAYDPYQLHHWSNQIRNNPKLNLWMREFPQGPDRLKADKSLYDLVRDRKLHHSGNEELREHVGHANAKTETDADSKMRFVKRNETARIDGLIALSMAAFEVLRLNV